MNLRLLIGALAALALGLGAMSASARPRPHDGHGHRTRGIRMEVFASSDSLTNPDDITALDGRIFVVWQNATKPDGSGGGQSTIVAYRAGGKPDGRWEVPGHVDGLTADP